jgi:hypothetical protein
LRQIDHLIAIADKALSAQSLAELQKMDEELNAIVAWFVKGKAADAADSTAFSVAIDHARRAIQRQRGSIGQATDKGASP